MRSDAAGAFGCLVAGCLLLVIGYAWARAGPAGDANIGAGLVGLLGVVVALGGLGWASLVIYRSIGPGRRRGARRRR